MSSAGQKLPKNRIIIACLILSDPKGVLSNRRIGEITLVSIIASGLVTAVGFNAPASLAAIRAGISGAKQSNLYDRESGEYITAAKVFLPHWWEGLGKLADLVAPAIHECLSAAPNPREEIPILLGVAAPDRPHRFEGLDDQLLDEVEYRLGLIHHPASAVINRGRVSGIVGIQLALQLIKENRAPFCIVAAVDSFLQQQVVEVYLDRRRILTSDNSNGFIPGEAGSAVLVARTESRSGPSLEILGIGFGKEHATIESETPFRAEGLEKAIRHALAEARMDIYDVTYRITDLNGEHYKFKEAAFALMRFEHEPIKKEFQLWHPIECIGDPGAAIGPCVLSCALHAGQKGYGRGEVVLCHFGNDDGERAAVVTRYARGIN